jgi:2-keto-4-pentenoate hydratase/2-oxohepta-3-ene-1,7-dioic acid hydratase in catechol pathway
VRIARFSFEDEVDFGAVEGDEIAPITGHPFGPFTFTGYRYAISDVRLLAPVIPSKVVAVGKNYADHAREMGGEAPASPVIFLKPSTAVIGSGDPIQYPPSSTQVDFEGELAIVIGRLCRDVPASRAASVILGYTCANDVTARDQQSADGQWARAKGYDSFCPLGPWITTNVDPSDLELVTTVNGEERQRGRTSDMVHGIPALIEFVSHVMTLLPGDVILTGTPAGVGPLQVGDVATVEIEGIGKLTNHVTARG